MPPDILKRIRTFWLVREAKAPATVEVMLRRLGYMQRNGFDLVAFLTDPDVAQDTGDGFLAWRRAGGDVHGYNNYVKTLQALARFGGHEHVRFRILKLPDPVPKSYDDDELALLLAFDHPQREIRMLGRALVQFALTSAWRRSEIAALEARDLDLERPRIHCRKPAKGGLRRWVPVEAELFSPRRPFLAWLNRRPQLPEDPGAVWVLSGRGGPRRLTVEALGMTMQRIGRATGVRPCSFVRSRHTRATQLLEAGLNLRYVQFYLGHRDPSSTAIYANVREDGLEEAMRRARLSSHWQR